MGKAWALGACVAVLVWLGTATSSSAQTGPTGAAQATGGTDQEARALFMAAQVAYDEGRFESAVQYFEQSHRLSGRPELLYNIGNTYDRLQQPEQALHYFEQYLQQLPAADNARQVEARVRLLRQAVDARRELPAPAATSSAAPAAPEPVQAPTPAQTAHAGAMQSSASAPAQASEPSDASGTGWVLWAGIGAGVVAAAVITAVLLSSGGENKVEAPLVPREGVPVMRL